MIVTVHAATTDDLSEEQRETADRAHVHDCVADRARVVLPPRELVVHSPVPSRRVTAALGEMHTPWGPFRASISRILGLASRGDPE